MEHRAAECLRLWRGRSASRPLFATWKIKAALEDNYREKILSDYCAGHSCQTSGKAEWREMVGAASERTLYILVVSTTVEQDRAMIEKFNDAPNENHFNGVSRNCADFTRNLINTYFPHATHREVMNDFGITTPKPWRGLLRITPTIGRTPSIT